METLYESLIKYNNSDVTALYYENKKYSFSTFLSNVRKMVTYLKNQGIKENDVITIVLSTRETSTSTLSPITPSI